jgi:hypothetical protein
MSFYYKVDDKIYSVNINALSLVKLFELAYKENPLENISADTALEIPLIKSQDDIITSKKYIDVIDAYIQYWSEKPKEVDYISEDEKIQTGYPEQILKAFDLNLLKKFSDNTAPQNKDYETMYRTISSFQPLLKACSFLKVECLLRKICAYCATFLYNTSLSHIGLLTNDPSFEVLTKEAEDEWIEENKSTNRFKTKSCVTGNL